ncbi:MAG TPA: DUF1844 domain-containing protein [Verrucomicrobiota bacterium]|nr:DUF1844 domain-containing protein [Verrucomicrobiota bacterium]
MTDGDTIGGAGDMPAEEMRSALFAQLVMQQSSMALMLMGRTPHPETGQIVYELDTARLFVEQLEMLQAKTRGNLTKSEEALLKQTLMTVRLAYVEAVEHPPSQQPQPSQPPVGEKKLSGQDAPSDDESKKRFSKKFDL